jgi:hypothetical protein
VGGLLTFSSASAVEEAAISVLSFVEQLIVPIIVPPPASPLLIMPIKQDTESYGCRCQDANRFTLDMLIAQPLEDGRLDRLLHY